MQMSKNKGCEIMATKSRVPEGIMEERRMNDEFENQ